MSEPREPAVADLTRALDERTKELAALGAKLAAAEAQLAQRPGHGYRHLKRVTRAFAREGWRVSRRAVGQMLRPVGRLARALGRVLLPAAAREALARRLERSLMSPAEYRFDRFRRARIATYGGSLASLRTAANPDLVSVVLCPTGSERHVVAAVTAVLSQTWTRLELIVVDDGSDEQRLASVRTCAEGDARVQIVVEPGGSLGARIDAGLQRAVGEYLTWTTDRDCLEPGCLERLVACLRRRPEWDAVYANVDLVDDAGAPLRDTTWYDAWQHPRRSEHIQLPPNLSALHESWTDASSAAWLCRSRVPALLGACGLDRATEDDHDYWMRANTWLSVRHADMEEPLCRRRMAAALPLRYDDAAVQARRSRLRVFDDYRRDLALSPVLWVIDAAGPDEARAADGLMRLARDAGHIVLTRDEAARLTEAGVPVVHVAWTRAARQAVVAQPLPIRAVRVLIADGAEPDLAGRDSWEMCVVHGASTAAVAPGTPWLFTSDLGTLFRAIDIRAKSTWLARAEALADEPDSATRRASVVICARHVSERLARAVRSVACQLNDPGPSELIVVDNSPGGDVVREGTAALARDYADVRVVWCPVPGLSFARNAGLAAARGEIVCFLDDDVVAEPDWLRQVCAAFELHPDAGVVGGHIHLQAPDPRPPALAEGWEQYWSHYVTEYSGVTEVADWRGFPWGANWSARRQVLRQMGGFRSRYGRVGANFWGGEELVAACLAKRLGYAVLVAPAARVSHHVHPSRFTCGHVRRTIAAGRLVGHAAERDGYLPSSGGIDALLGLAAGPRRPRVSPWTMSVLDGVFWQLARVRLLVAALSDLVGRWRTPIDVSR